jgi:hypothetical protein
VTQDIVSSRVKLGFPLSVTQLEGELSFGSLRPVHRTQEAKRGECGKSGARQQKIATIDNHAQKPFMTNPALMTAGGTRRQARGLRDEHCISLGKAMARQVVVKGDGTPPL